MMLHSAANYMWLMMPLWIVTYMLENTPEWTVH
jgi:hypothetical protein